MAIRLEKSGGLIFVHGAPDPPVKKKTWWSKKPRGLGPWIVLALFIAGALFAESAVSEWPAVTEAVKNLIASVR